MKAISAFHACGVCGMLAGLVALMPCERTAAARTNIFSTQFESAEGYRTNLELIGQNDWVGGGSGGNGIVTNYLAGQGQQAYVGFFPPKTNDDTLFVWKPLNFSPLTNGLPLVKF